jgi:predicted O-methyltransferase YrrM
VIRCSSSGGLPSRHRQAEEERSDIVLVVNIDELIAAGAAFHLDERGQPVALGIDERTLRFMDRVLEPEAQTLETGAGLSTAFFALKGVRHTCSLYDVEEIQRIRDWCADAGISTDRIDFHWGRSEDVLPTLKPEPLDLVLIDGGHEFPTPFVDWLYAGRRLRGGGVLVLDDTEIWTGRILRRFLIEQPGWELVEDSPHRAAAFRRTGDEGELQDWFDQPFVVRRSLVGNRRRVVLAWELLRRGRVTALARDARRMLRG